MSDRAPQQRVLFVSWRDPGGSIFPIGRLVRQVDGAREQYSFAYVKLAERLGGFEPLPGLPDLYRSYESPHLFPVFSNRVMPRSRPEFDALAARVDLTGDADPFEVLARTGGRRATDRIEVFLPPERTPEGTSTVLFFARGIRYVDGAESAVARLHPGDRLTLVDDRSNEFNPRALVIRQSDGQRIGWIPDYLIDHVHELRDMSGEEPVVSVEHVNDRDTPAHMRLLCRLSGPWPDGYVPFSGAEFQPLGTQGLA
jgi:hypothetical protein